MTFNVFYIHNSCSLVLTFIPVYHFRKMDVQVVNVRRNMQTTVTITITAITTTTITAITTTITITTILVIISERGAECKPGPAEVVEVERTQEAEVVLLAVRYFVIGTLILLLIMIS